MLRRSHVLVSALCPAVVQAYGAGFDQAKRVIEVLPLPPELHAFSQWFTKYTPVFGLPVLAARDVPDWEVVHAAGVLAQYLDWDEDGRVNNEHVHSAMLEQAATLVMFPLAEEAPLDAVGCLGAGISMQDVDADDIPSWVRGNATGTLHGRAVHADPDGKDFDGALEEVLHLITDTGYVHAYPQVFGEAEGSLARNMVATIGDCGYAFNDTARWPNCTGRYHYADETCDFQCLVTEFTYWAIVSLLGGEDGSHGDATTRRCKDIGDEWQMCTPALVRRLDPALVDILGMERENPYGLPTMLPDGRYQPSRRPAMLPLGPRYQQALSAEVSRGACARMLAPSLADMRPPSAALV